MSTLRQRFKDAPWFPQTNDKTNPFEILLIGAGGIGSRVIPLLLSLGEGIRINVYDGDTVSEENLISQFFTYRTQHYNKVAACSIVSESLGLKPHYINSRTRNFTEEDNIDTAVVILAVDNMTTRKLVFDKWKERCKHASSSKYDALLIDGRMNAEQYQVFYVTPDKIPFYEETLFSDDALPPEACTYKNTGHFGWLIAVRIIQGITAFLTNNPVKEELYYLPFKVSELGPAFDITIS